MGKGKKLMSLKQQSEKARESYKRHGFVRFLAFAAIIVAVVFVGYTIIKDNISIRENERQLQELTAQTDAMKAKNEQITGYLENEKKLETYIEDIARDKLDFANGDERIFYVIPSGN